VVFAIILATCALVGNMVFLIVVTIRHKPGPSGLGTLREGVCKQVDLNNKVAHGFINVISTVSESIAYKICADCRSSLLLNQIIACSYSQRLRATM
jgi:hypothetical protein